MATCLDFVASDLQLWSSATKPQFLHDCHSGVIREDQFNTWLVQHFTRMAGRLLAAAPDEHLDTLLSGLRALQDELCWFQAKAQQRGISLQAQMQPSNERYVQLMESLGSASYCVQAATFWAIEHCYNQAWQLPGDMPQPYDEYAQRWGNQALSQYVQQLRRQADEALQAAHPEGVQAARAVVTQVAQLEVDFWDMAYSGSN